MLIDLAMPPMCCSYNLGSCLLKAWFSWCINGHSLIGKLLSMMLGTTSTKGQTPFGRSRLSDVIIAVAWSAAQRI